MRGRTEMSYERGRNLREIKRLDKLEICFA